MVRLRLVRVQVWLERNARFQFLYGTIKTKYKLLAFTMQALFQFLYGTIKTNIYKKTGVQKANFNSCMVRLRLNFTS